MHHDKGIEFLPSRGGESQAANDLVTSALEAAASGSKGTSEVGTLLEQLEKYTKATSEKKQNDTIENNSLSIRQHMETARDLENHVDSLKVQVHTLTDQVKELEEQKAKLEEGETLQPAPKKIKTCKPPAEDTIASHRQMDWNSLSWLRARGLCG